MATLRTAPSGTLVGSILAATIEGPIAPGIFERCIIHAPGARTDDFVIPNVERDDVALFFQRSLTDEIRCFAFNFGASPLSNIVATFQRFTINRAPSPLNVTSLWVGAPTASGATVVLTFNQHVDNVRLQVFSETDEIITQPVSTYLRTVKIAFDGLSPNRQYRCRVLVSEAPVAGMSEGLFHTLPAGPTSFLVAFGGDAIQRSNHVVWDSIRQSGALLFQHLGDTHYRDIIINDPALYREAYDERLASPRQGRLMQSMSVLDTWDDHDYGADGSDGSSPSRPAAVSTYRERVPHHLLPDANGGIYYSYTAGRVIFIVTDQRSLASPSNMLDGPTKTMLGSAQRAWFESILASSAGHVVVWICARIFGGPNAALGDSWGGFATERAALVSLIHDYAPGRCVVIAADAHFVGIDDGSHHDFLPGGGEPLPTFQAAPLDQDFGIPAFLADSYSEGTSAANGQFGTMEVIDTAGPSIDIIWRAHDQDGSTIITYPMTIPL